MKIISKKQLLYNLYLLKVMLLYVDKQEMKNIDFISINAFCDYLDNKNNNKYNSLNIIKNIDKYIPISICNNIDIYSLLKNSLNSLDLKYINYMKQIIYKKAILSFLDLLSKANTKKEFFIIFDNCNNIRECYYN